VGLSHDNFTLIESSDFSLLRGTITGLVGTNGAGKTSLAKVIASKELPGFPKDRLTIQYVSSHENWAARHDDKESWCKNNANDLTPEAYLHLSVQERIDLLQAEIDTLEDAMDSQNEEQVEEMANRLAELYEVQDDVKESLEREIQQILTALEFGPHLKKKVSQLSLGWQYKCRLAAAFTTHPDILIFDEPSFLDHAAMDWFIQKTKQVAKSGNVMVVLISHKEALLEKLCDRMLYLNSANRSLSLYHCGYETFRSTLSAQVSFAEAQLADSDTKVHSAEKSLKFVQSQLHKREANFKARKNEDSDQRFVRGKNKEAKQKVYRSSASKLKQLQKEAADLEEVKKQAQREQVKPLVLPGTVGDGTLVLFQNVTFSYNDDDDDDKCHTSSLILDDVDARLEATDRILLRGANGSGKSTLIQLLLGELQPTSGSISQMGGVRGNALYFPQTSLMELSTRHGMESAISYLNHSLTETKARQHLGTLGLTGDLALRPIGTLSAGQRVRLWLAKQLLDVPCPSLLIMDEISENMDVETRVSLSDLLNQFVGAVLVVSHDEDFCAAFSPTQIWNLTQYGIRHEHVSGPFFSSN
jgi:ATP-binding cassette, subfamily F, member 3